MFEYVCHIVGIDLSPFSLMAETMSVTTLTTLFNVDPSIDHPFHQILIRVFCIETPFE